MCVPRYEMDYVVAMGTTKISSSQYAVLMKLDERRADLEAGWLIPTDMVPSECNQRIYDDTNHFQVCFSPA